MFRNIFGSETIIITKPIKALQLFLKGLLYCLVYWRNLHKRQTTNGGGGGGGGGGEEGDDGDETLPHGF